MDKITPKQRSENMRRIRSSDTKPEMIVRRLTHALGYRYRLHVKQLPGKPDLVFPRLKKVIFVHGCFWHQHSGCIDGKMPQSNLDYWSAKLERNLRRDQQHVADLREAGWDALVIWECQTKDARDLAEMITRFLGPRMLMGTDGPCSDALEEKPDQG